MLLCGSLIVIAGLVAYRSSLQVPFLFDDQLAVVANPSIRRLWPLTDVLSPPQTAAGAVGRPLVNLSLAVNHALGGMNPWSYHAFNLAIHVLAGLALFGLTRRLMPLAVGRHLLARAATAELADDKSRRSSHESPASRLLQDQATAPALANALLWTVHPLQTESVTCVIQRSELLGGLFYLVTLYGFVRAAGYGQPGGSRREEAERTGLVTSVATSGKRWLVVSWLACLLGMAAKEVVVSAPLLVLLCDRTFFAGTFREAWRRRRRYYLALGSTWLLLGFLVAHNAQRGGTAGFGLGASPWHYLLTQCRALVLYLKLCLWPHPLVLDYGMGVVHSPGEVWWQAVVLLALLAATVWAVVRKPPVGFLGAWFFAILAPTSSVLPLTTQTMAEHRMYLPLAAVIALVVAWIHALGRRRSLALYLALAVLLTARTVQRNHDYRTALAIWEDTVAKWPDSARARTNLAVMLSNAGRDAESIPHHEAAIRLDPTYAVARYNYGLTLLRLNRPEGAIARFAEALRLKPDYAEAHNNWGGALLHLNRPDEAWAHFETAVKLNPDEPRALCNLGAMLRRAGRNDEARASFENALRSDPDQPDAHMNLGAVLAQAGRIDEAIRHFEAAARFFSQNADLHFNWGSALLEAGRNAEAIRQLEEAVRLNPGDAQARAMLDAARRPRSTRAPGGNR